MTSIRSYVAAAALGSTLCLAALPSLAHHGWSWAEGEQMTLQGAIQMVSMSPPHPSLEVKDGQGTVWQIDLGNPNQTARSGFTAETAAAGDAITVIGNRNKDRSRAHMNDHAPPDQTPSGSHRERP